MLYDKNIMTFNFVQNYYRCDLNFMHILDIDN